MRKMTVELPDDLDEEFRKEIFNRFDMRKGNLNKAVKEAVKDWIKKNKKIENVK